MYYCLMSPVPVFPREDTLVIFKKITLKKFEQKIFFIIFHRKLSAKIIKVEKTPNLPELENFWCNIWEEYYNKKTEWVKKMEGNNEEKQH